MINFAFNTLNMSWKIQKT